MQLSSTGIRYLFRMSNGKAVGKPMLSLEASESHKKGDMYTDGVCVYALSRNKHGPYFANAMHWYRGPVKGGLPDHRWR